MSVIGKLVVSIVGDMSALRKDLQGMQTELKRSLGKSALDASKALTTGILGLGAGLGVLGGVSVKLAADLEQTQIAFAVLTGSTEKAKKMIAEFQEMGAKTPYETKDLLDAAQTMMMYGIEADKTKDYLMMLGDVSAGNADKLKMMTLAFSQVQATGRLMGQDLLQMINAGFNPLQVISEKTGKSMSVLKGEMEKGSISSQMVADAFKVATSEGGRFYQMMDKQSETLNGLASTLKDDLSFALIAIGQQLIDTFNLKEHLKGSIEWLNNFVAAIHDGGISEALRTMIPPETKTAILAISAAIFGMMIPALKAMAINSALALVPLLPYAITFAAVGLAIGYFNDAMQRERYETEQSLKAHQKQLSTGDALIAQYKDLASKTNKTNEEKAKMIELSNKIAEILPNAITGYDKEGNAIIDLNLALVNMITLKREELALRAKELDFQIRDLEAKNKQISGEKELIGLTQTKTQEYKRAGSSANASAESEKAYTDTITKKNAEMKRNQVEIDNLKTKQQDLLNQSKNVTAETIKNDLGLTNAVVDNNKKQADSYKELTDAEKKKLEERVVLELDWQQKYHDALANETKNLQKQSDEKIAALEAEKAAELVKADKLGADKTNIINTYALKEKTIRKETADAIAAQDLQSKQALLNAQISNDEQISSNERNTWAVRNAATKESLDLKLQLLDAEQAAEMQKAIDSGQNTIAIEADYNAKRKKLYDDDTKAHYDAYKAKSQQMVDYLNMMGEGTKSLKDIIKEQLISWLSGKEVEILASIAAGIAAAWGEAPFTWGASLAWIPALMSGQGAALAAIEAGKAVIRGLETGGLVKSGTGGGVFQVGEGSQDEIVMPLSTGINMLVDGFINKLGQMQNPQLALAGAGGTYNSNDNRKNTIVLQIGNYIGDEASRKQLVRDLENARLSETSRRGE